MMNQPENINNQPINLQPNAVAGRISAPDMAEIRHTTRQSPAIAPLAPAIGSPLTRQLDDICSTSEPDENQPPVKANYAPLITHDHPQIAQAQDRIISRMYPTMPERRAEIMARDPRLYGLSPSTYSPELDPEPAQPEPTPDAPAMTPPPPNPIKVLAILLALTTGVLTYLYNLITNTGSNP